MPPTRSQPGQSCQWCPLTASTGWKNQARPSYLKHGEEEASRGGLSSPEEGGADMREKSEETGRHFFRRSQGQAHL